MLVVRLSYAAEPHFSFLRGSNIFEKEKVSFTNYLLSRNFQAAKNKMAKDDSLVKIIQGSKKVSILRKNVIFDQY